MEGRWAAYQKKAFNSSIAHSFELVQYDNGESRQTWH